MDAQSDAAMLTRRSWLQGSALIALYAWAATGARAVVPVLAGLPVDAIVIDVGLPDATTLARGAGAQARVEMLGDDPAELFYRRLVPAWRKCGVRGLAGLTRAPALFLLEPLTAEYGLRMVGLLRAPSEGCDALTSLCYGSEQRASPVNPEPVHGALRQGDDATFAWWMAPLHPPLHAGVTAIPA